MYFKFNQAWTSAELLSTGLRPQWEVRPPCCILREGGAVALVEMCIDNTIPMRGNGIISC